MKKTITTTKKEIVYECDVCYKEYPYIKDCEICGRDVCSKCAIRHDFCMSLREKNNYDCDRPYFICPECWDLGIFYREEIQDARDALEKLEDDLMERWKELGKSERNSEAKLEKDFRKEKGKLE